MKKFCSLRQLIFALLLVLLIGRVKAVGLSVTPPELKVTQTVSKIASAKLTIKNFSDEVAIFEVYPDDFESLVKISPSSFILESGEKREVGVQSSFRQIGQYGTVISVISRPVSISSFNAAGGLKIPITVVVNGNKPWYLALVSSVPLPYSRILGIGLLILIIYASFFVIKYGIQQIKS
ncbi:MAG: hypothetical protein HYZ69_01960 [Candidatus Colwellbacteria bacterium]|nr:hypothetical protein [Candidatus Colwellbacteria bacterium]